MVFGDDPVIGQEITARYSENKFAELRYIIRNVESEQEAQTELRKILPDTYLDQEIIPLQEIVIDTEHFEQGDKSKNIFRATVRYSIFRPDADHIVAFDTTGGTQKVTQSYLTVAAYPAGSPNLQGAINFDGERVNGVDIGVAAYEFTEQHFKDASECSQTYRNTLALMTYTMNNAPFRGFAAGEVLYKGCTGQQVVIDGVKKWQLNFKFAVSPNRMGFYVGSNGRSNYLVTLPSGQKIVRRDGDYGFKVIEGTLV